MRDQFIQIYAYRDCRWNPRENKVETDSPHYLVIQTSKIAVIIDWIIKDYSLLQLTNGENFYIRFDQKIEICDFLNPTDLSVKD